VAKIDTAEIDAPLVAQRNFSTFSLIVVTLIVIVSAWYAARFITTPIRRLTEVATNIQQGHLDQRVAITSHDEIGVLGTAFNDMTTTILESRARLTASIKSVPFGFGLIDTQNHIVFSNALFGKLLGHAIPDDPARSRQVLERIHKDFKDTVNLTQLIKTAQTKQHGIERNIEFGPMFLRLYFAPILADDTRVLGTIMLVEDTTERMTLQRSRDEFFSIASHELRTPLTAIRGNTEMMIDYYKEQLKDPDLFGMVKDVRDASIRLIDVVNDFLDMSRLEQGRVVLKSTSFDIGALVTQTLHEYDVTGSRRKLKLELLPSAKPIPPVFADRERTRQILINVLSNAIKYTQEGGVSFSFLPIKKHGKDLIEISIKDTGSGISPESQRLLFHKFQQATENILTRDNTRSTGLGLYISRLLCEDMGGTMRLVESEVGKGSTFAFTLPVTTPKLLQAAEKTEAKH
jgi:PAS domain S-box-containing protein